MHSGEGLNSAVPFDPPWAQNVDHVACHTRIAPSHRRAWGRHVGSIFAFQLARIGGHDVTVIARPGSKHWEQLRRDGAIVDLEGSRASARVMNALDEQVPFDLLVVTLLAYQADAVLPALRRSAARCVQFMQHLRPGASARHHRFRALRFRHELRQGHPRQERPARGHHRCRGQKTLMGQQCWADLFDAAGLQAKVERDMPAWLRCHVQPCVAFESVSVAGARRGGGGSWKEALALAHGVHAGFGMIKDLGFQVYPRSKALIDRAPASMFAAVLWPLSRVRTFRELPATGEAECEALADAMIAAAAHAGSPERVVATAAVKPS